MGSFFQQGVFNIKKIVDIDSITSGSNAAAVITLTGVPRYRHYLALVIWSYSSTPTAGRLTITGLEGDDIEIDVTVSGPGPITLPPVAGDLGGSVTVTLAAGGVGVVGKLSIMSTLLQGW